jgi:hypothetical protein
VTAQAWTVAFVLAVTGCGSSNENAGVDRCVDRMLSRSEVGAADEESARSYVRRTYCERFEGNGWVDDDGVLSIAAQRWLDDSGTCEAGGEGQPSRTVPCEEFEEPPALRHVNCALLHHVRRSEVRAYVAERQREGPFACDDGTPLAELGVP